MRADEEVQSTGENDNSIVHTNWLPCGWKKFIVHSIHQSGTHRQLQKQKSTFNIQSYCIVQGFVCLLF